jgi:hypothetical protein
MAENTGWSKATTQLSFAKILLARVQKGVVGFDLASDDVMGSGARLCSHLRNFRNLRAPDAKHGW